MPNELQVATLNLNGFARLDLLARLVTELDVPVGILLAQEAGHAAIDGYARLYEAERILTAALARRFGTGTGRMRAFYTPSDIGPTGQVVFLRDPQATASAHWRAECPNAWHDKPGIVTVHIAGCPIPLTVASVHLPYWSGDQRLDAARRLTRYAADPAVIGGDMNSLHCADPNEPDWTRLPAHRRHHKSHRPHLGGPRVADRRALAELADAGFIAAAAAAGDWTPTVNPGVDHGAEAAIDHILVAPALADAVLPDSYRVHTGHDDASDHRMVSIRLDLDRISRP